MELEGRLTQHNSDNICLTFEWILSSNRISICTRKEDFSELKICVEEITKLITENLKFVLNKLCWIIRGPVRSKVGFDIKVGTRVWTLCLYNPSVILAAWEILDIPRM